jgi:hypothetical protein
MNNSELVFFTYTSFSTVKLETEIIIYRHLLDSSEIEKQAVIDPLLIESETTEKLAVQHKRTRKGSIGIGECSVKEGERDELCTEVFFL